MLVAVQLSMVGLYLPPVFKFVPSNPPQTIISLPVQTAANSCRPAGALVVLVAIQLSVPGLYLPPVFRKLLPLYPPQTIISLPVHTAMWLDRALGALVVVVAVHVSSTHPFGPFDIAGSIYLFLCAPSRRDSNGS